MKVGIITFHRALNYGAVLQAYALQSYLNELGIESEVIDYRSEYIEHFYKPIKANPIKEFKKFLREILYAPSNIKKRWRFNVFIKKHIRLSKVVKNQSDLQALNNEYDFFLAGSDQIWNSRWSGFDKTFFLDFAFSSKKYSYAASFGTEMLSKEEAETIKNLLHDFQAISVRERTGEKIVRELVDKQAIVSVDPTCLIVKEKWEKICDKPTDSGYILMYTLEKSDELLSYAKKIAQERDERIICILDSLKKRKLVDAQGFLSPAKFLGLFANASCVVTNSFHGLLFSTIFEKEVCLQYQKGMHAPNSRLRDFVKEFGLEACVLGSENFAPSSIDYNVIKQRMKKHSDCSKNYLLSLPYRKRNTAFTVLASKEKCFGCRACEQICSQNAIVMKADNEGFLYPFVCQDLCISCKQCKKVCPSDNKELGIRLNKPLKTSVAYINDECKRMKSRSGGVYVAVSDYILENGGVVYGAALTSNHTVCHTRATNANERDYHCGSKYVQSDTLDTYKKVVDDLSNEKKVIYSGTACQVAGLLSFLNQKNIKLKKGQLVTIDIVCHGVLSPRIWKDNLEYIERVAAGPLECVDFRDKSFGWDSHIETYYVCERKIHSERYTAVFYEHNGFRPTCYHCPYSRIERLADITLADAWGIKRAFPEWETQKGVSFLMANTLEGIDVINAVDSALTINDVDLALMMQPNLVAPTKMPSTRSRFWQQYNKKGYVYVSNISLKKRMKICRNNQRKAFVVRCIKKLRTK